MTYAITVYFRLHWATGKVGRWHVIDGYSTTDRPRCGCGTPLYWHRNRRRVTVEITDRPAIPWETRCRFLRTGIAR